MVFSAIIPFMPRGINSHKQHVQLQYDGQCANECARIHDQIYYGQISSHVVCRHKCVHAHGLANARARAHATNDFVCMYTVLWGFSQAGVG